MTAFLTSFFVLFWSFTTAAQAADVQADWDKAVQIIESGRSWIPGRVVTQIDEKNKKQKTLSIEVLDVSVTREGEDGVRRKLVRATKGRDDITMSRKEKVEGVRAYAEHVAHQKKQDASGNPFSFVAQEGLTVTDMESQQTIQGRVCRHVSFVRKVKRKEIFKGMACLDLENAQPLIAEVELMDRPMFVKSLRTQIEYGSVSEGVWGVKGLKMKGHGGMLGMRRYFETKLKMGGHWKLK